ncbi:transcriptional regulator [Lactobacillus selangorensis]|uniref:Transcriptional regulator n=1 Tax=Lactobacillus selangorensis TaxID=81857 RepID=A0A0R2FJ58_9LACO|nr:transcriptional regulator [Lactobacillus selangorensis]KRN32884.1 transcriptional regulator [Lactobacillus selangorensis]
MKHFVIDGQYKQLLSQHGLNVAQVLKKAQLPESLFLKHQINLTEEAYYRLMNAISTLVPDAQTALELATGDGIESFSAPIYAAFCSENGLKCIERLSEYKLLIGPVQYQITSNDDKVTLTLVSASGTPIASQFFVEGEFAFLVNLITKATQQTITPFVVTTTFEHLDAPFEKLLGGHVTQAATDTIAFRKRDLMRPFISDNQPILNYLEPELNKRLSELEIDDSFSAQVRSALAELLPAGESTIEDAARKLNIGKRTLQRNLHAEKTSFQKQLNSVREVLAKNYLQTTQFSSDEIAFLIGYQGVNSFLRAFSAWTGMTVSEYRKQAQA